VALVSGVFSLPLLDPVAPQREFLAGEENILVRAALSTIESAIKSTVKSPVQQPDANRFPLVICGPTGSGKTFLAEGLAETWCQKAAYQEAGARSREVLRTNGTDFAREYADACDTDSIGDFREKSSRAGLILVDAIHPLASKERAAREFCYQLDTWLAAGQAVIVTSLKSPLEFHNAALASRLSGGLLVPLSLPSLEVRRELLNHFARQRALELSDELIDSLAERVPGAVSRAASARDLLAALVQLESTARLIGCEIDGGLVSSLFSGGTAEQVDFKRILAAVSRRYGVTADELRSSSRRQTLVRARGVAVVLARRLTGESLQSLGRLLGKRDHSTIHHALQTIETTLATDHALGELVDSLQQELTSELTSRARKGADCG
jgi:chromosomal replication initiator protein